jgi:hypothetical protein
MQIVSLACLMNHAWRRLTAVAMVLVNVVANENVIQGKLREQSGMYILHDFNSLFPGSNIGLVCCDQQQKSRFLQSRERVVDSWQDFKVRNRLRRMRFAVPDDRSIQHSVTIEKDGALGGFAQRTDSHLVSAAFREG